MHSLKCGRNTFHSLIFLFADHLEIILGGIPSRPDWGIMLEEIGRKGAGRKRKDTDYGGTTSRRKYSPPLLKLGLGSSIPTFSLVYYIVFTLITLLNQSNCIKNTFSKRILRHCNPHNCRIISSSKEREITSSQTKVLMCYENVQR